MTEHEPTQRQRRHRMLPLLALCLLSMLLCSSSCVMAQRRSSLPTHSFNKVAVPVLSFRIAEANGTAGVGVVGRSVDFVPAFAGIALPLSSDPDSLLRMNIMLPHKDDDPTGCSGPWRSMNEFNQSFAGSFILQRQATCINTVNYLYATFSGARGVIAYGCPTTEPFNCAAGLLEVLVYTRINTATVLSVTNADGEAILAYLTAARDAAAPQAPALNSMVLEFVSTGPIVPEEKAALVSMMQTTTMFPFAGGQVPAAQDLWSVARFNSTTQDPCRDRVKGLWCEKSHVVWVSPWYHAWLGLLPPEFGLLTQLRAINLFANRLGGPLPASWCNLHQLRSLAVGDSLASPFISSFPDCLGSSMPLLEELYFSGHSVKLLPASIALLTNLRYLEGPRNELAGPLPDLTAMPNLTMVSLSANKINGSLPPLHPDAPLSQYGMAGNQLTGTVPPNYFVNKPLLRILDLNTNQLTGSLPPLTGCPNLEIVDFSTNAFSGPVPGGLAPAPWSTLQRLNTLNLQENELVSPVFLANLQALTRINLSNNKFNTSTLSSPSNTNVGVWMDGVFPPNLLSLRISHNQLRGPWGINSFVTSKTIQEIFADHNQITTLPNEFFVVQALQMDVSGHTRTHRRGRQIETSLALIMLSGLSVCSAFSLHRQLLQRSNDHQRQLPHQLSRALGDRVELRRQSQDPTGYATILGRAVFCENTGAGGELCVCTSAQLHGRAADCGGGLDLQQVQELRMQRRILRQAALVQRCAELRVAVALRHHQQQRGRSQSGHADPRHRRPRQ